MFKKTSLFPRDSFPKELLDPVVLCHLLWLQPILVLDIEQHSLLLHQQLNNLDRNSLPGSHGHDDYGVGDEMMRKSSTPFI